MSSRDDIEDELISLIFEGYPSKGVRLVFATNLTKETGFYVQEIEEALNSLNKKGLHILIYRDGFQLLSVNFTNLDHTDSSCIDEDDINKEGRDE